MAERLVTCARLGKLLPGLEKPPFPGTLGQKIFDTVSADAWAQWQKRSTELMREKNLSLLDGGHRKILLDEMQSFLFGAGASALRAQGEAESQAAAAGRQVDCVKLGRRLPGLDKPPLKGPLGQRVFEQVSKMAWEMWTKQSVIVMNHYGLNMADPEGREFLLKQMEDFFFGPGAQMPADWVPPAPGGKGGGGGGKGAPGARRK